MPLCFWTTHIMSVSNARPHFLFLRREGREAAARRPSETEKRHQPWDLFLPPRPPRVPCAPLSLSRGAAPSQGFVPSPRLFRVAQHEQSLMTKSRSSFWRRAAARIRDDQVVAVEAVLCLPRFLRLWTNRASSMPCRQATDFFFLLEGGNIQHRPERETKPSPCHAREGPAEPPPVSFLPPSQKAKKRKRSNIVNSGRPKCKQPESRYPSDPAWHDIVQTGQRYLSRRPFQPDDQPESSNILPLGDGRPHLTRLRFTSTGCQPETHSIPSLSASRLVAVDDDLPPLQG